MFIAIMQVLNELDTASELFLRSNKGEDVSVQRGSSIFFIEANPVETN